MEVRQNKALCFYIVLFVTLNNNKNIEKNIKNMFTQRNHCVMMKSVKGNQLNGGKENGI